MKLTLLAYNLSFAEVSQAINESSLITTGGTIKTDSEEYLIRANSRSYFAKELSNLVVKSDASGKIIKLKDISVVKDQFSETLTQLILMEIYQ